MVTEQKQKHAPRFKKQKNGEHFQTIVSTINKITLAIVYCKISNLEFAQHISNIY